MKKCSMMAKGVMIAMGLVSVAHADDKNWTGFYAGVNSGFSFNDAQLASNQLGFTSPSDACNVNSDFSTFAGGVQLGYLHQFPSAIVSGVEINTGFNNNQKHTVSCQGTFNAGVFDRFTFRNQMQASIKGRVGRPLNGNQGILPYLTAGVSVGTFGLTYTNEGGDYYSTTATSVGGLMGGGVEWAFMPHWSLRAEYNFVDYGNVIRLGIPVVYGLDDPNGSGNIRLYSNNIFVAVNYWV